MGAALARARGLKEPQASRLLERVRRALNHCGAVLATAFTFSLARLFRSEPSAGSKEMNVRLRVFAAIGLCACGNSASGRDAGVGASEGSSLGDAGLRALTHEDVVGLPAGDASGHVFSGLYQADDAAGRQVDETACSGIVIESAVSGVWELEQSDGTLSIYARGGINGSCDGGIDGDGTFWCGRELGIQPASRVLLRGRITFGEAERVIDAEVTASAQDRGATTAVECVRISAGRLTAPL